MSLDNNSDDKISLADMTDAELEENIAADLAQVFGDDDSDEEQPSSAKPRKAAEADHEGDDDLEVDENTEDDEIDDVEDLGDEDDTEDKEDEKPQSYKLKSGDEVTLDELENGYLREKDYRTKTQDIAETRKKLASLQETVVKSEAEAKEALTFMTEVMQAIMPQAPSMELLKDPSRVQEYMVKKAEYEAQVTLLNEIAGKAKSVGSGTRASQEHEYNEFLKSERALLSEKVPELKTPKALNQWMDKAAEDAETYWGADPSKIKGISDHVSVMVLRDALAYRRAKIASQAKKAVNGQTQEATRTKPLIAATLRPGTATTQKTGVASRRQLQSALDQSSRGDDDALAAMISRMLK